jgi:dienelactone hydrolase
VAHGYGQLAEYFLRPFASLDPSVHFIVAPEGLSRFYLQGVKGRVGASWMTREERLMEIADQHQYLDRVWQWIQGQVSPVPQLVTLGFSQGVPTILRWLDKRDIPVRHIVCWAGSPPEDAPLQSQSILQAKQWLVWGDADEYIDGESKQKIREFYRAKRWQSEEILFNGRHQIDPQTLSQLANRIMDG